MITVCTPTFNRAYCLSGVYDSLCSQNFRDFEWIIVDDGSTDETSKLVEGWSNEAPFLIRYIWQENSGKHVAVNTAINAAKGELFLIFDSDDRCTLTALNEFWLAWQSIEMRKDEIAGITVLSCYSDGEIIGSKFPFESEDFMHVFYDENKISGDKWDIHQTRILKEFSFPVFTGEKFCPEVVVWNRISSKYKTMFLNKPLKIVTYLPDGLSANSISHRISSCRTTLLCYSEQMDLNISLNTRFRASINYVRFSLHSDEPVAYLGRRWLFSFFAILPGLSLWVKDRYALSRK